jgi:hypothetical protein
VRETALKREIAAGARVSERSRPMADRAERLKELTRNFPGRQVYVMHTTPNVSREELDHVLPEHIEQQIRLEKSGDTSRLVR